MSERIDYDRMSSVYDRGRALPPEALDGWRGALAGHFTPAASKPLLDLGSGTGIWSSLLADWFETDVVAVEPSKGMRRQAAQKRPYPRVFYMGGDAERIPLRDGSCTHAWLSTVIHHVPDLSRCARELRRVLAPGGRVLIRSAFSGRMGGIMWARFFPAARRLADEKGPTVDGTVKSFAVAGFQRQSLTSVAEISAPSLHAYYDKIRTRADTWLTLIPDEDFEGGLNLLAKFAEQGPPGPVISTLDLLVLQ